MQAGPALNEALATRSNLKLRWAQAAWQQLSLPPVLKVAKGIVIFHELSLYSISNESIFPFSFSCGHDLRNALWGVGTVNAEA